MHGRGDMLVSASVVFASLVANEPVPPPIRSVPRCQPQQLAETLSPTGPGASDAGVAPRVSRAPRLEPVANFKLKIEGLGSNKTINPCCPDLGCCPKNK